MVGNLLDLYSMHRVIDGCDTMYFGMSISDDYLAATVNTAAVAKHHGVKAFVNMSQMTVAQMCITARRAGRVRGRADRRHPRRLSSGRRGHGAADRADRTTSPIVSGLVSSRRGTVPAGVPRRRSRIRSRRETMGRASSARSTLCARRERDDFAGSHPGYSEVNERGSLQHAPTAKALASNGAGRSL